MPVDPRIQAALDLPLTGGASIDAAGLIVRRPSRGFAAPPGSGPAGERCATCAHCYFVQPNVKRFYKCRLTKFTHGQASDIRVRALACSRWEARADG